MDLVYDYVIVGAGSAGCVLARRLADANANVLLLESGGWDANPLIHIPVGMGKLHAWRMHDWGYDAEPDVALDGRRVDAMRGKVVGGSSSVNVMIFTRGHRGDYDRWAQIAPGWSFEEVLPYFKRMESWQDGESEYRGGQGPLGVEWTKSNDPLFPALADAGRAAGFPITPDFNGEHQEGFGRSQFTIQRGRRASTARAFLRPVLNRKNLTVAVNADVTRIFLEGSRARGAEYVISGRRHRAIATHEVIISAGAFNSPKLLMLSGIGPAEHLRACDIDPVVDLPVGDNLQDHVGMWMTWNRKKPGPFVGAMRFDRMVLSLFEAYFRGTGAATVMPGGLYAFLKTKPDLTVPDLELMFRGTSHHAHLWFPGIKRPFKDGFGIRPTILHPKSRGAVRLRSGDYRDTPKLDFRIFSDPCDLQDMRQGFKLAWDLAHREPLAPYRDESVEPSRELRSDQEIDAFIRKAVRTAHHPAGTCAMGRPNEAVLDADLRVYGIGGLRVVDASAMPDLVSGHINAAVIMMADRASDLILKNGPGATAANCTGEAASAA
jgi:choline dehydrogenase-like flavoprotein